MTVQEEKINIGGSKYQTVHKWVYKNLGKASFCSNNRAHLGKRFEWANISKKYLFSINDWKPMCPSCHRKFDFKEETRVLMRTTNKGKSKIKHSVQQFTTDGVFIKKFRSITEASREIGILRTSIMNALAGRAQKAGGYLWL